MHSCISWQGYAQQHAVRMQSRTSRSQKRCSGPSATLFISATCACRMEIKKGSSSSDWHPSGMATTRLPCCSALSTTMSTASACCATGVGFGDRACLTLCRRLSVSTQYLHAMLVDQHHLCLRQVKKLACRLLSCACASRRATSRNALRTQCHTIAAAQWLHVLSMQVDEGIYSVSRQAGHNAKPLMHARIRIVPSGNTFHTSDWQATARLPVPHHPSACPFWSRAMPQLLCGWRQTSARHQAGRC